MKNYKLSDETKAIPCGIVLHRIVATTTFTLACGLTVNAGDVGGWIEKESNLSGNAWVSDNAQVFGDAQVYGDALVSGDAKVSTRAQVYGNAKVSGNAHVDINAHVSGNAWVYGNAHVSINAHVFGNAQVFGDAQVGGEALVGDNALVSGNALVCGDVKVMKANDHIVFKNDWSSGRYFTWTKSNDMWRVGCFYGTSDELIKKAYADSEVSGKHYEACVKLVKTL